MGLVDLRYGTEIRRATNGRIVPVARPSVAELPNVNHTDCLYFLYVTERQFGTEILFVCSPHWCSLSPSSACLSVLSGSSQLRLWKHSEDGAPCMPQSSSLPSAVFTVLLFSLFAMSTSARRRLLRDFKRCVDETN